MEFKTPINLATKKQKASSIVLIAMLTLSIWMFAIPVATAATSYPIYSFVTGFPNPAGVNQDVLVLAFIDRYPPSNASNRYIPYVDFIFDVTITDPTGIVTTKKIISDPIGGSSFMFNPDKIGTWTIKMHFEGAGPIAGNNNNTYLPSDSNVFSLVVQQDPIPAWPAAELPTGYWQRPINGENREWAAIAGSWMGLGSNGVGATTWDGISTVNPYSKGPTSAHIVWTMPLKDGGIGGVVGFPSGDEGYYTGDSYERQDVPVVVMNGIIYRNIPRTNSAGGAGDGFEAIDLRTGELLWKVPNGTISYGQLLVMDTLNQHGVIPYLWNNAWQVFDAATGKCLIQFNNSLSGVKYVDDRGNIIQYTVNYNQKSLIMWNSTLALQYGSPVAGTGFGAGNPDYWRPNYNLASNQFYNWSKGIQWNVTIPDLSSYGATGLSLTMIDRYDDVLICRFQGPANDTYPVGYLTTAGFRMSTGAFMWAKLRTDPAQIETGALAAYSYAVGSGMFVNFRQETLQWHGYSATTGDLIWTSQPYEDAWGTYYTTLSCPPAFIYNDKLYTIGFDGMLHCFNVKTGVLLWNALGYSSGSETPYGSWPTSYMTIADGKVYVGNGEHSPNQPTYRGYELYCVDANTGDLLWKVSNYAESPLIADGHLLTFNGYDMQYYCFNKGLSKTTVQAPLTAITAGTEMTLLGTVTDQSPGQTCLGIPAAGTPAVSDDSMTAWMEYLYMQQPKPNNATGVQVSLVAISSDGTVTDIGKVQSDSYGMFATHWQVPETAGVYTIFANFAGTNSYYASDAETAITVVAAPVVTPSPTPVPTPEPTIAPTASPYPTLPPALANFDPMNVYYAIIAAVVVMVIALAAVAFILSKKK